MRFIVMPDETLVLRADASAEIGVGHVMRCAALAQAWGSVGGRSVFALARGGSELEDRLRTWGFEVVAIAAEPGGSADVAYTNEICARHKACWLVMDGYHFPQGYRTVLKEGGTFLLFVDDLADGAPYGCDIVLNNNLGAERLFGNIQGEARFLLGPRFALLRQEFLQPKREVRDAPTQARRILVTFGGADPQNISLKILQALLDLPNSELEVTVVVGASNPHHQSLEQAAAAHSDVVRIVANVENMPELMSNSDCAISAGGGTCYELAFMQVPMLLVIVAKNQVPTVNSLSEADAAASLGWFDSLDRQSLSTALLRFIGDQKLRDRLRRNAGRLVDGLGAQRVVDVMREIQQKARR